MNYSLVDSIWHNFRKAHKPSPNKEYRELLFWLYDGKCAYCSKKLKGGWHADHMLAYHYGGKTIITNMCASCPKCNMDKSTDDWANKYNKPDDAKLTLAYIRYMKMIKWQHLL